MTIISLTDSDFYAEVDDVFGTDTEHLSAKLTEAYLKGFESGRYFFTKKNREYFRNIGVICHECLEKDIKNIIVETSSVYLYSPLDTNTIFDLKNDVSYWMDILVKSGDIKYFNVEMVSSENDNGTYIIVTYADIDNNEHSITTEVFMGAFN